MTQRTTEFAKTVAQMIEFAGFGPCAAVGAVVAVQAFDVVKRYPVMPNLTIPNTAAWRFPSKLSPGTIAALAIIEDAYVAGGMEAPGSNSTIRIESPELPFSIEVRYLWLTEPTKNTRLVVTVLLNGGEPVWACESLIDYYAKRDSDLPTRIRTLTDSYKENHPNPDSAILEIIPEILDTIDHL